MRPQEMILSSVKATSFTHWAIITVALHLYVCTPPLLLHVEDTEAATTERSFEKIHHRFLKHEHNCAFIWSWASEVNTSCSSAVLHILRIVRLPSCWFLATMQLNLHRVITGIGPRVAWLTFQGDSSLFAYSSSSANKRLFNSGGGNGHARNGPADQKLIKQGDLGSVRLVESKIFGLSAY